MRWSVENKIVLGFGAALLMLSVIGVVAYYSTMSLIETANHVVHTYQVLETLEDLRADLVDAESGGRGYIITGAEQYLKPYHAARANADQAIRQLRTLTADNSNQQQRLDELERLVTRRLAVLAGVIDIRRVTGLDAATELIAQDAGRRLMDDIQHMIDEMEREERVLLELRGVEATASARTTRLVIVVSSLLAFIFVAAALVILRRDIAGRRRAEEGMRRTQLFLDSIVENIPTMLFVKDATELRFVRWNKAAEDVVGFDRAEMIGKNDYDLFPEDEAAWFITKDREVLANGSLLDIAEESIQTRHRGLRILHTKKIPILDASGQPDYLLGISEDVTERKQAEVALRLSEERFSKIFHASPVAISLSRLDDGCIVDVNQSFLNLFEYRREEVIGHTSSELQAWADSKGRAKVTRMLHERRALRDLETTIRTKSGVLRHVLASIELVDTGGEHCLLALTHDITDRKRAEEEISRLNQELKQRIGELTALNHELEAFSYSVSHDLRAPLRSIDGFSLALLEDYAHALDPTGQDYLRRVRGSAQRMAQLIDDLLQLSRVTRSDLRREPVDLGALASRVAAALRASEPERAVDFIIANGVITQGDPRLLQVLLENLIGNAWKFTKRHTHAHIEFGTAQQDGKRVYFVHDDGAGFDMAYASKLFGVFQRLHAITEFEGTGIGLATVQRIVHRHGGQVWAQGAVDQGATFYFTLN